MANKIRVSAPGKLILSGEHAVVYGYPAILAAVDKRLMVDERGVVESLIPMGVGMGSSAALSVATAAAERILKGKKWDLEDINNQAYQLEKKYHGNPSGGDNTIVTYGGFLWYRKEISDFKIFTQINSKIKLPKFFLINSGSPEETTGEMIMEKITREFLKTLIDGSGRWGELIRDNEKCLESLGVVSKSCQDLIREIEKVGGAAKISGAGGRSTGSGLVLSYHQDPKKLEAFFKIKGLKVFNVKLGEEGVRIEK